MISSSYDNSLKGSIVKSEISKDQKEELKIPERDRLNTIREETFRTGTFVENSQSIEMKDIISMRIENHQNNNEPMKKYILLVGPELPLNDDDEGH